MQYKILIADDDKYAVFAMKQLLEDRGFLVDSAASGEEAIAFVKKTPFAYGLVILDYKMPPGKDGAATAREILDITDELFILIHSGDPSRDAVHTTWKAGAVTFIEKNANSEAFIRTVKEWATKYEETFLTIRPNLKPTPNEVAINSIGLVGRSSFLADLAGRIKRYETERDATILITGETGAGKGAVAEAFHRNSPRKDKKLVAVNCAAIPENLIESILFGHEKGAFTGAHQRSRGKFLEADGGTIFLDEIGEASASTQVKLLRALQERVITPVGGTDIKVDVRVIAATNVDLISAIETKKFREDLFYRLNVISVTAPPLRDRPEDIEPLIHSICARYNEKRNRRQSIKRNVVAILERYPWPGNVRELDNEILKLLIENPQDVITKDCLDPKFFTPPKINVEQPSPLKDYLDEAAKTYVHTLLNTSKSVAEAARKSGMKESTFRDLLRRVGNKKSGGIAELSV